MGVGPDVDVARLPAPQAARRHAIVAAVMDPAAGIDGVQRRTRAALAAPTAVVVEEKGSATSRAADHASEVPQCSLTAAVGDFRVLALLGRGE